MDATRKVDVIFCYSPGCLCSYRSLSSRCYAVYFVHYYDVFAADAVEIVDIEKNVTAKYQPISLVLLHSSHNKLVGEEATDHLNDAHKWNVRFFFPSSDRILTEANDSNFLFDPSFISRHSQIEPQRDSLKNIHAK
ncbi:hypothetical protein Tcan_06768 [Toxocara canis]|uniref:Uncharacterized protein n=1 Tax=Toxocara canis TaxID=6265 RepID=A0A0B2VN56_TOXCA|nr:hypothetical protein Tcan_06768 [Toxocara canis]